MISLTEMVILYQANRYPKDKTTLATAALSQLEDPNLTETVINATADNLRALGHLVYNPSLAKYYTSEMGAATLNYFITKTVKILDTIRYG